VPVSYRTRLARIVYRVNGLWVSKRRRVGVWRSQESGHRRPRQCRRSNYPPSHPRWSRAAAMSRGGTLPSTTRTS